MCRNEVAAAPRYTVVRQKSHFPAPAPLASVDVSEATMTLFNRSCREFPRIKLINASCYTHILLTQLHYSRVRLRRGRRQRSLQLGLQPREARQHRPAAPGWPAAGRGATRTHAGALRTILKYSCHTGFYCGDVLQTSCLSLRRSDSLRDINIMTVKVPS